MSNAPSDGLEPIIGNEPDLVNKSVLKAATLLRALAAQPSQGATSTVLARTTRMSRPTAFRLLYSLEQAGLVDRIGNNYVLGWDLARMGRLADPNPGLAERVQPHLQELADKTNEMTTLQVVNGRDGLDLIAEAMGSHLVNLRSQLSDGRGPAQWPLHATAAGKVFLASMPREKVLSMLPEKLPAYASRTITKRSELLRELDRVREQDYGLVDSELEEELAAVSRPVRDLTGAFVAVLTLSAPRYRFSMAEIHNVLLYMDETRAALSEIWGPGPNRAVG
ncbi:IclR family transcriptional regulator [Arthrobacter sp. Z4-13]